MGRKLEPSTSSSTDYASDEGAGRGCRIRHSPLQRVFVSLRNSLSSKIYMEDPHQTLKL